MYLLCVYCLPNRDIWYFINMILYICWLWSTVCLSASIDESKNFRAFKPKVSKGIREQEQICLGVLLPESQDSALLLCPCLFRSSDNVWRSQRADVSHIISHSWITEQISVGKCAHWGTSARQRIRSAKQNCHLDKTNMDETNLYRYTEDISGMIIWTISN